MMMLWMWHVTCWNKVVCTEGLLMEGSGSVLGFHSSYLASQRNLGFLGSAGEPLALHPWGGSVEVLAECPQHLTRSLRRNTFPCVPKWGVCAESLFIWGNRDSTCVTAGWVFLQPLTAIFHLFLGKSPRNRWCSEILCPWWVRELWALPRYPGQGSLLLVGASHPAVGGGMRGAAVGS